MAKLVQVLLFVTFLHLTVFTPPVQAQAWGANCYWTDSGGAQIATLQGLECIILNVVRIAIRLIGIAAFVMFVFGGIKMISSGGNSESMGAAQQTMTLAITGIVVAVLSWFILRLIESFTGAPVTQFDFPTF